MLAPTKRLHSCIIFLCSSCLLFSVISFFGFSLSSLFYPFFSLYLFTLFFQLTCVCMRVPPLICVFPWGILQLQDDWSLPCDNGLDYASICENNNKNRQIEFVDNFDIHTWTI